MARQAVALCALLALAACQGAAALYSSSSPVIQLDPSSFKTKLKSGAWMVEVGIG